MEFGRIPLIILVGLILWLSTFLLNNLLLDNQLWKSAYLPSTFPSKNDNVIEQPISQFIQISPNEVENFKVIIFWTNYFQQDLVHYLHDSPLKIPHLLWRPRSCYKKFSKCFITSDRSFLESSKALIFHWRDLNYKDLPKYRNSEQSWILYNLEAPPNTPKLPERSDITFNWTATYRKDSDIFCPYDRIVPRDQPINLDLNKMIDLKRKNKPIVWFVSNCHTQSHRENYVKELSKLLQIDIYGRCGPLSCPFSQKDECYQKAAREYLFYLSFENSICKDYVTEKFFNVLKYDIIPIVLGGANYSSLLPPGSFIDATQMSPDSLAKLVLSIASSRKRYLKFFEWRKKFYIPERLPDNSQFTELFCEICEKLEQKSLSNVSKTWKEINRWWFDDTCHVLNF